MSTEPPHRPLLLCIDAPSLLHRHHHARSGTGLVDRGGRPAWALHGMVRQVVEVVESFEPDAVVLGLDDKTRSVRATTYPDYKAGRAAKDPELVDQLGRAGALLEALGLLAVTPDGLEADDVSASASAWAEQHGWRCVVVTSDRDAFAHISEHTEVLRLINGGLHGSPLLNPARLQALYGVAADRYLEYAALRGDASDNLPGVEGIGEKGAAALLAQVGSMHEVWADLEHCGGATLAAALDDWAAEHGQRRSSAGLLRRLAAPGARERFEFNLALMAGRRGLDLGLRPDATDGPGRLPLDADRVRRVVGHLGVEATTEHAVRVLGLRR
jgi:DNA polymerase-1